MDQQNLFHEDIFEALKTDIQAIGGTKTVGSMLWPEKPMHESQTLVSNCLNRGRAEKFDLEQVLLIKREAKRVGSFAAVFFECDDIGMSRPHPIEPEDERARLQRDYIAATKAMADLAKRMERLAE